MRKLRNLFLFFLFAAEAHADAGRLAADYGYFSIRAKASGNTESISNPSAIRIGYLRPVLRKLEFSIAYSMLLADFSGSDLGYGLDVGANYYPFSGASDETYKDERVEMRRQEIWRPYAGAYFHQRNFQSVKNSYAGFGAALGVERFLNDTMNIRGEARMIQLAGSGESKATEVGAFLGVVFKL